MKIRRAAVVAGAVAALGAGLAACSQANPSLGQYAIITGHGALSNQQVIGVAGPGQLVNNGGGTTTWYVYADVRNYVTGPNGDRLKSTQLLTGTGAKGEPAIPVYVDSYVPFELNPAIAKNYRFAGDFLAFCLKYACATQQAQNDTSNAGLQKSSTPGWENMLNEIMPVAIDNATRESIGSFPPSVWSDQSMWPALATDISKTLVQQLDGLDGAANAEPYFCGIGSTTKVCKPLGGILIRNIQPVSAAVRNAYNQGNAAVYQEQAAQSRLNAARILYGPDANWALAIMDIESNCPSKCTIVVGNAPIRP